ncbi:hypothetical protein VB773_08405 [Haloarculaceae archaeon H-GB2-1]|nr:hypothetical protein [Haloarculaceae archaeon H-GB1-1]MEA5407585.1 hypothetical protein [Haloarculaceae archaeon H-GB2-1]
MPSARTHDSADGRTRAAVDVERLVMWLVALATVGFVVWSYVTYA